MDDTADRLHRLDTLDRISHLRAVNAGIQEFLGEVLALMLNTFDGDRAYLLYPCDPRAPLWNVPYEETRSEWPGAAAQGVRFSRDEMAGLLENVAPLRQAAQLPTPPKLSAQYSIRSQLAYPLKTAEGGAWLLGLHHCRESRVYDERHLGLLMAIGLRINDSLGSLAALRQLEHAATSTKILNRLGAAILVVDASGAVAFANRASLSLSLVGPLAIRRGRISAARKEAEAVLQEAIRHAAEHDRATDLVLKDAAEIRELWVTVLPFPEGRKQALLVIHDPRAVRQPSLSFLRHGYRLSDAECRLASALGQGLTPEEYAEAAGIRISTVRTQIRSVLLKTGTKRITDIVRLLGGIPHLRHP